MQKNFLEIINSKIGAARKIYPSIRIHIRIRFPSTPIKPSTFVHWQTGYQGVVNIFIFWLVDYEELHACNYNFNDTNHLTLSRTHCTVWILPTHWLERVMKPQNRNWMNQITSGRCVQINYFRVYRFVSTRSTNFLICLRVEVLRFHIRMNCELNQTSSCFFFFHRTFFDIFSHMKMPTIHEHNKLFQSLRTSFDYIISIELSVKNWYPINGII